jgi:CRISPR-associated endonuclease/helicase Cas3
MDKIYYAHSGRDPEKSDWQRLEDHLTRVARLAGENARYFGAEPLAELCGLLHDLGKYSEAFAKRLEGGERVDHTTAGAKVAVERWPPENWSFSNIRMRWAICRHISFSIG